MKKFKILKILVAIILIQSCEHSDCIELEDNIPDPINSCDTGLLIIRSNGETGEPHFLLDSIPKPTTDPLSFMNIREDAQDDTQFDVFNRPSNYDAYNPNTNEYIIEFPLQQRLYKYKINSQERQELIVSGFYSAPIFNNNVLFTITIDNFGYATDPANYSIETINVNDGAINTLTSNTFPLVSSFNWESMSSAKDDNGNLFFISGTNLISFNIPLATATHFEMVPDFNSSTNYQRFFGLEYRNNNILLAIRSSDDSVNIGMELVEININNPTEIPVVIFDFLENGIDLNSEFYSTSYDACDDTYYLTTRNNDDVTTTDFYEISLSNSEIQTENFPFYLMGIESKN